MKTLLASREYPGSETMHKGQLVWGLSLLVAGIIVSIVSAEAEVLLSSGDAWTVLGIRIVSYILIGAGAVLLLASIIPSQTQTVREEKKDDDRPRM